MPSEPVIKASRPLQIGKYQVLARVATGGMGAVYRALDVAQNRVVALKVLSPEHAAKPRLLERFRLEALHGGKVNHPNVVTLYEAGEANGIHFLALEFVDGVDLREYATQQGKLDVEESRVILIQAVRAIAHLYELGLIHRDIKPANFMVRHEQHRPVVKLIDLGLALNVDDEDCKVTRDGSTLGTVDYISPEQARDSRAVDIRSDIYSLGCTWFHLLAGQPPFAEGTIVERVYKHIEEEPPDIRRLNPAVPAAVARVLRRMLAKDPADRYQTPAALLRDLEALETKDEPISKDLLLGLASEYERGTRTPARGVPVRRAVFSRPGVRRRLTPLHPVSLVLLLIASGVLGFVTARVILWAWSGQERPEQQRSVPVAPGQAPSTSSRTVGPERPRIHWDFSRPGELPVPGAYPFPLPGAPCGGEGEEWRPALALVSRSAAQVLRPQSEPAKVPAG